MNLQTESITRQDELFNQRAKGTDGHAANGATHPLASFLLSNVNPKTLGYLALGGNSPAANKSNNPLASFLLGNGGHAPRMVGAKAAKTDA